MPTPSPSNDIRASRTVRLRTAPTWLPERYRRRAARIRIQFTPTAGERRLFRRRKPVPPSVWAPVNRVNTYGPLKGSRWDNSFMPHLRGIMDASFYPSVEMIGNLKVPQSGSSACGETMIGYIADMSPADTIIAYPDRDTAAQRCADYMTPMFKLSPRLRSLMTGRDDDAAALRLRLSTMTIYMAWAGSDSSLGNKSGRFLIGDEIDKWPEWKQKKTTKSANKAPKEAPSLKLFMERFRSFRFGKKAWLWSTPTLSSGPIWQYMLSADVLFTYHVDCPDCGQSQPMGFSQIRWEGKLAAKAHEVDGQDLARYVCLHCGSMWDDRKREKALQTGVWRAYGKGSDWVRETESGTKALSGDGRELFEYLRTEHPKKICFYSPGWITPLVRNSEMAASFLAGQTDPGTMQYFDNQLKGIAYTPARQDRREDAIYLLADERPDGLVPGDGKVACLTAGVDTQDDGFPYVIRAWGWGKADGSGTEQDSWLVAYGKADTFADLVAKVFHEHYRDAAGLYYPVHKLVIDSGGHHTGEVYEWSRAFPGRVQVYKGASGRRANPKQSTVIDHYPGTKIAIPGGLNLLVADSHHYKDILAARLKVAIDAPGAHRMLQSVNQDNPRGADYAAQMCAEYLDERGLWQCPEKKANHLWDCEVLNVIAEDLLKIKYWPRG